MIHFIGAGPGDPDLITVKAQKLIAAADVIVYAGSLVNPAVLAHARPGAEIHDSATMVLADQLAVMAAAHARGQTVARLHTGDPSIYGAIAEQMRGLDALGVPYTIVPGVSSAFAAAAALGIEYTLPGETQTVILSRLGGHTPVPEREALRDLAAHRTSLVLFLSAGMLGRVVEELRAAGYAAETPIAVVSRASWPDELVVRGTLSDIASRAQSAEITHQALVIVSPALRPSGRDRAAQDSVLYGAAMQAPTRRPSTAIVALTRGGSATAARLHAALPGSVLYVPERFRDAVSPSAQGVFPYASSVRQVLQAAFAEHSALVCVMASGIVVRDLAPLVRSKHGDPGVVVVDEGGRFAVSLLAGHQGGGNELARQVAALLGGAAVITTSSDVQGLPPFDLLGRERGWVLDPTSELTAVSSVLVNGETVAVVQEAGDESWWPDPLPANLVRYPSYEALVAAVEAAAPSAAALLISHRLPPASLLAAVPHAVIYHPRCLAAGIGCNRGTPAAEILAAVDATLAAEGLAPESLYLVATIENKIDEPGLLAACRSRGWCLHAFTPAEILAGAAPPNPSPWAQEALGVPGVAEPAVLLAAGTSMLLAEKRRFPNVTVALALTPSADHVPAGGHVVDLALDHDRGGQP